MYPAAKMPGMLLQTARSNRMPVGYGRRSSDLNRGCVPAAAVFLGECRSAQPGHGPHAARSVPRSVPSTAPSELKSVTVYWFVGPH